jgi:thymidine kinase
MAGFLHMIIGPMCAGKTTELLKKANQEVAIGRRVLLINHALDTRHDTSHLTTHTSGKHTQTDHFTTVSLSNLTDIFKTDLYFYDVICIDELQFFDSPRDVIQFLVETLQKIVYGAGLIADFKQSPFGDILPLVSMADRVEHCTGLCSVCNDGTVGCFTMRRKSVAPSASVISVGDCDDTYMLVCRAHFQNAAEFLSSQ